MIEYNFKNGALDDYLGELIGKSREAITIEKIRGISPKIKSTSLYNTAVVANEKGIFVQKNGIPFRAFMYLKRSKVDTYGLPKRHYFICEKVRENLPYVLSNQELVTVTCSETGKIHKDISLHLCAYCKKEFQTKTSMQLTGDSIDDFILDMEESDTTKTTVLGIDGYVINWNEISTAYRRTKDFTCEKCGVRAEELKYMHTHHIDYDKTNNRRSNLQCLCIACHADVDDIHRKNFSTVAHQREIRKFNEKYKESVPWYMKEV